MLVQGATSVQLTSALTAEWVAAASTEAQPEIALTTLLLTAAVGAAAFNKAHAKCCDLWYHKYVFRVV
jgi:hypothetical protein